MHNLIISTLKRFCNNKSLRRLTQIQWRQIAIYPNQITMTIPDDNSNKMQNPRSNIVEKFGWLSDAVPGFPINASQITIIHEPTVFYSTLLKKCHQAEKRITLASLYLGTGQLEGDLVKAIEQSIQRSNGKLKVNILLDYMRGSRGKNNSRKILEPLLKNKCVDNCKISLYHTPKLRGILKTVIPNRFNELIGLQHMKIYIFDDSLIISGANLSNDYFTNRQDRYFLIENCKELCDFYNELIVCVSEFSFKLLPGDITSFDTTISSHPLKSSAQDFSRTARDRIRSVYTKFNENYSQKFNNSNEDTWIFPLIEMGQLGISQDSEVTLRLLKSAETGAILRLATGYFNLTTEYSNALLKDCQATCQLLTAHPTANGFYGAKGVAGGIPAAYTAIEKSFYKSCEQMGLQKRITLREYVRPGWTYHAKGLWYTLPNERKPTLTFIGSSNFGYRSVRRDLETQIAVVTKNKRLQAALQEEYDRLYKNSQEVNKNSLSQRDRIAPAWVCAAVLLFRYYF